MVRYATNSVRKLSFFFKSYALTFIEENNLRNVTGLLILGLQKKWNDEICSNLLPSLREIMTIKTIKLTKADIFKIFVFRLEKIRQYFLFVDYYTSRKNKMHTLHFAC